MGKYGDDKSQRGFVIENLVWDAASDRAKKEGVTVSAVIRAALEAYAEGDDGLTFGDALAIDLEAASAVAAAKAALAEAKAKLAASKGTKAKTTTPTESKPAEPAKAAAKAAPKATKPAPKATPAAAKTTARRTATARTK